MQELHRTTAARLIVLALACLPAALSQTPLVTTDSAAPAGVAPPDKMDLIDKVLGIVGPSERIELTERERFQQYLLLTAGPLPLLGEAGAAAIGQQRNDPREWGQGWGAFGERYGSDLAYNGVRQTITYGMSRVFHEDTRYFGSRKHGFWGRTGYAILSTVTARHPDGRQTFSFSSVGGVIGASAISSIWEPHSEKGLDNIAENAGISFGATAVFNVLREFLPDLLGRPRQDTAGP